MEMVNPESLKEMMAEEAKEKSVVYTNYGMRKVKVVEAYCIFIYRKDEDHEEVDGTNPYVAEAWTDVLYWLQQTGSKLDMSVVDLVIKKMKFLS